MFQINENYLKLPGSYLFSNIAKKVAAYKEANPNKDVISLGIGDVTQPLVPAIIKALHSAVDEMAAAETFRGYAPDLGYEFLRNAIAENDSFSASNEFIVRFLSVMVQNVTLVIFRRFLQRIVRSLYVILSIQYM